MLYGEQKRLMRYRLIVRFSIAIVLAGCDSAGPSRVAVETTALPNPVLLSESTTITVIVTNISDRTIVVRSPDDKCVHFFSIVDSEDRRAELSPKPCLSILPPVELPRGESLEYVESWAPSSATIDGQPLTPGDYQVRPANIGDVEVGFGAFGQLVLRP